MTNQNWKASYGPSEMYQIDLLITLEDGSEISGSTVSMRTFQPSAGRAIPLGEHSKTILDDGMLPGTEFPSRTVSTTKGALVCYAKFDDAMDDAERLTGYLIDRLAHEALSTDIVAFFTLITEADAATVRGDAIRSLRSRLWQIEPNRAPLLISAH